MPNSMLHLPPLLESWGEGWRVNSLNLVKFRISLEGKSIFIELPLPSFSLSLNLLKHIRNIISLWLSRDKATRNVSGSYIPFLPSQLFVPFHSLYIAFARIIFHFRFAGPSVHDNNNNVNTQGGECTASSSASRVRNELQPSNWKNSTTLPESTILLTNQTTFSFFFLFFLKRKIHIGSFNIASQHIWQWEKDTEGEMETLMKPRIVFVLH